MLVRWGRFVTRRPLLVLLASLLLLVVSAPLIPSGIGLLSAEGWEDPQAESSQVAAGLAREFGQEGTIFWIVFDAGTQQVTDPAFQQQLAETLAPLRERPEIVAVLDYASTGSEQFISHDGHRTYVLINSTTPQGKGSRDLADYRELLASSPLPHHFGGWDAAYDSFTRLVQSDLQRQEIVSLPITLIVLVLVFGSLVAAGLPLLVGILSIPAALGAIALMAHLTDTSIYVLNIATILGLAVSIDYSLFIVSRFREELSHREVGDALVVALATAGKAVFFSGLIVAIGLLGLLFFPMFALRSLGIGGTLVVSLAVFYSLTFLPALLMLLGHRVNRGRLGMNAAAPEPGTGLWGRVASAVMRRPFFVLVPVVSMLIAVGLPFLHINFGTPGMDMLPREDESRIAYDALVNDFPETDVSPIELIVYPESGPMTDPANLASLAGLIEQLEAIPGVTGVESIFSMLPSGAAAAPEELLGVLNAPDPRVAAQAYGFLNEAGAHLRVDALWLPEAPETKDLVRTLRQLEPAGPAPLEVLVGGATAVSMDMVDAIVDRIPYALGFIAVASYIVLFLLLGSVFLPLKAILIGALSITASFGALVWIFQDGHLSGLLDFDATGYIVPMVPVMMFCILFGLSMDYEVLMLSRMQEEYEKHGDNTRAVAVGLERTGRVITGAAAIMVTVFGAAVIDRLVILKALGIGMALAVFLDATIVRALLVPATMRVMGWVNWWAPASLKRLQARIGMSEEVPVELEEVMR